MDKISLSKWQWLQRYKLQGMTNNVGLIFNVGDTTPRFIIMLSKTVRIGYTKYQL